MEARKGVDKAQITQKLLGVDLSQASIKKLDQNERKLLKTALSIINNKSIANKDIDKMFKGVTSPLKEIDKIKTKLLTPTTSKGDNEFRFLKWVKNMFGQRVSSQSIYNEYKKSALVNTTELIKPENIGIVERHIKGGRQLLKEVQDKLKQSEDIFGQIENLVESIEGNLIARSSGASMIEISGGAQIPIALGELTDLSERTIHGKLDELVKLLTLPESSKLSSTYEGISEPEPKLPDPIAVQKKIDEIEKLCLEYDKALQRWEGIVQSVKQAPQG